MMVRGHLLYARRYSKHLLSTCVFSLNSHSPMGWIRFMLISQMMKLRQSLPTFYGAVEPGGEASTTAVLPGLPYRPLHFLQMLQLPVEGAVETSCPNPLLLSKGKLKKRR